MTDQEKETIINTIIELTNKYTQDNMYKNVYGIGEQLPKEREFIITNAIAGSHSIFHRLGYVVQIRKNVGDFGSDMYFIIHPNGKLATHENQDFKGVPDNLIELCRSIYVEGYLPEDIPADEPFGGGNTTEELGFIIEESNRTVVKEKT